MKAVRIHAFGKPDKLIYEDAPDPKPTGDEVIIQMAAASINPVDLKMRSGEAQSRFPVSFPAILGRDVSGMVVAVGLNVRNVKVNDRVMALGWQTYAELVAVKADLITHIPDGISIVDAAALPLIVVTGDQLIRHACNVQNGQTVLVTGATGSVGRAAIHAALKANARVIAGVHKKHLKEAEELGAQDVIALDDEEALAKLGFVDAIADTVGGSTASTLLSKVKQGGIFGSLLGEPEGAKLHPTVQVKPMMAQPDPSKVREFADDYRDGKFKLPIHSMLPLHQAAEAHEEVEHGASGKVLLLASERHE